MKHIVTLIFILLLQSSTARAQTRLIPSHVIFYDDTTALNSDWSMQGQMTTNGDRWWVGPDTLSFHFGKTYELLVVTRGQRLERLSLEDTSRRNTKLGSGTGVIAHFYLFIYTPALKKD